MKGKGGKPFSKGPRPQGGGKGAGPQRPQAGGAPQPRGARPERSERHERSERSERPARHDRPERAEKPSPFSLQTFTVEGQAAVAEYLRFRPAAVTEVRATPRLRADVERLVHAAGLALPVLERQSADEDAAPVTARVTLKALEPDAFLSRLAGREKDVLLAVDHITDPRNLGAIVRSAAFFGLREVIVPERRQVLLTQSAVHTAQGGFALADLVCVTNLARTLSALKDEGYWIIGTAMDGEPHTRLAGEYSKVVLVLGSEESGLSHNVRTLCDRLAAIPGKGGLESLNVSVAAGIVLSEFSSVDERPTPK